MLFSNYSQPIYYLQNSGRDTKYAILGYLALLDANVLQQETCLTIVVALFKTAHGREMLPAGLLQGGAAEGFGEDIEGLRFQRKMYVPLQFGQLSVTDKRASNTDEIAKLVEMLQTLNNQGFRLSSDAALAPQVAAFNSERGTAVQ